jgi:2-polyprenyl-6-hydroxyphenyl methylase/3-demethylubiquinone-9 3-methyltransferase
MTGIAQPAPRETGVLYETVRAPEKYVQAYNELMAQPTNRLRIRAVAETLLSVDDPIARVIDIASGGGAYVESARAALRGRPRFFAADRQFACVGGYRLNHPETAGALADVTALPFRSGSFDLAMCLDIIEHLDDDEGFLRDVGRLIRPRGWLLLSTHNSSSLQHLTGLASSAIQGKRWLGWDPTHVRFYNARTLKQKLASAGFETVALDGTYYLPFHLPARLVSWPLERLGLRRTARIAHRIFQAPGYWANLLAENVSHKAPFHSLGWGIVVLARRLE